MSTGYIRSLDGVRAIAILLVMTFHANLNDFGWMGVQLFFVLSGFLITGILWKEKFSTDSTTEKLKRFWWKRTLRIFPLYFGYLLFWAATFLLFRFPTYFAQYAPYLFTYTFNYTRHFPDWQGNPLFTHLWSLCVEEQFYLFFPLLVFLLPPRGVKWMLVLLVFLTPLIRFLLGEHYAAKGFPGEDVADLIYWNTASHLDAFFLGGAIQVLSLNKKIRRPGVTVVITLALVLVAGAVNYFSRPLTVYSYAADLGYGHGQGDRYQYVWIYTVLNLFFAALLLFLTSGGVVRGLLHRVLEHPVLVRIGQVSYGMYLFHWAVFVYAFRPFLADKSLAVRLVSFLPYAAVVYGLAELSFRLYEKRFLALKKAVK